MKTVLVFTNIHCRLASSKGPAKIKDRGSRFGVVVWLPTLLMTWFA